MTFVLAHGRPIDQTIAVMKKCPNTYTDTAFMPVDDIKRLIGHGLTSKILFGTDAPINLMFYPEIKATEYITKTLDSIRNSITTEQFNEITGKTVYV